VGGATAILSGWRSIGKLVAQGLRDKKAGRETPASLLIDIGWPRLHRLGMRGQKIFP